MTAGPGGRGGRRGPVLGLGAEQAEGLTRRVGLEENRGSRCLRRSRVSWKLEGSYFETCSCNVVCPCTASLALGATLDRCRVTLVFKVENGEVNGTDVGGLTVAVVADTPKVMTDGNWRLGVFLDAAASDEQAEK